MEIVGRSWFLFSKFKSFISSPLPLCRFSREGYWAISYLYIRERALISTCPTHSCVKERDRDQCAGIGKTTEYPRNKQGKVRTQFAKNTICQWTVCRLFRETNLITRKDRLTTGNCPSLSGHLLIHTNGFFYTAQTSSEHYKGLKEKNYHLHALLFLTSPLISVPSVHCWIKQELCGRLKQIGRLRKFTNNPSN